VGQHCFGAWVEVAYFALAGRQESAVPLTLAPGAESGYQLTSVMYKRPRRLTSAD
jgi:hypothetical protein